MYDAVTILMNDYITLVNWLKCFLESIKLVLWKPVLVNDDLDSVRPQVIIWTNAGLLSLHHWE